MSKIRDTLQVIQSGARLNKYRILLKDFGEDLDIVCNSASMPGRSLSTTEVFVKGRKYRIASESEDEGIWEIELYNTPDLFHRRMFLSMIGDIHNYSTPTYLGGNGINSDAPISSAGSAGQGLSDFGGLGGLAGLAGLGSGILEKTNIIHAGKNSSYKQDVVIQQLDHDENVIGESIIHNTFVTGVGPIEYSDEAQGISTTSVTFTYSGITFQ